MPAKRPKKQRDQVPEIKADAIYSVAELAALFNCNRSTVGRWRKDGVLLVSGERVFLPYIKGGGAGAEVRFRGRSVLEFTERIEREGPDAGADK